MSSAKPRTLAHVFLCSLLGAQVPPVSPVPPVPLETPDHPAATILNFQANRIIVKAGEAVEFSWETRNALSILLDPPGAKLPPTGHMNHTPAATGVFWLSVTNLYGGESWPISIWVQPAAATPAAAGPKPAGQPKPASHPEARPLAAAGGGFWVQFAALASREAAETLARRLTRSLAEPTSIEVASPAGTPGPTFYRVHTGPYATRPIGLAHLRAARKRLEAGDTKPIIVEGSPPLPGEPPARPAPRAGRRGHRRPRTVPG